MVAVALAGAVGAYLFHRASVERERLVVNATREAVGDIERKIRYLKATEEIELNELGWPEVIDPRWFKGEPPRNIMLGARYPWLEVASTMEYALDHPVQRVAINERLAGLWYNPAKGIVRARVMQTVSDEKTIELYNRVNGSSITELFDSSPKKRILEEILREDEELEEFEEEQREGIRVRRPGDEEEAPQAPDDTEPEIDESAPLPFEDETDPGGPVREDDPPASEGGPVEEDDGASGGASKDDSGEQAAR
jgi:hypothetical protein